MKAFIYLIKYILDIEINKYVDFKHIYKIICLSIEHIILVNDLYSFRK